MRLRARPVTDGCPLWSGSAHNTEAGAMRVEFAPDGNRSRQVLPQDGGRHRLAVHMQTALVRCANGARDQTVDFPSRTLTGWPACRGNGLARSVGSPCCSCADTFTRPADWCSPSKSTIGNLRGSCRAGTVRPCYPSPDAGVKRPSPVRVT